MDFHFPTLPTAIGATISAALGTVGVEVTDIAANAGEKGWIIALAGVAGGLVAASPAIIRALTDSRKAVKEFAESEHEKLITRIHNAYDRERVSWEAERKTLQAKNERTEAICAVLRHSKHQILNHCQYAVSWANLVQLLSKDGPPSRLPEFNPPNLADVSAVEDEAIAKICGVPTASTPPRVLPRATPMKPGT